MTRRESLNPHPQYTMKPHIQCMHARSCHIITKSWQKKINLGSQKLTARSIIQRCMLFSTMWQRISYILHLESNQIAPKSKKACHNSPHPPEKEKLNTWFARSYNIWNLCSWGIRKIQFYLSQVQINFYIQSRKFNSLKIPRKNNKLERSTSKLISLPKRFSHFFS